MEVFLSILIAGVTGFISGLLVSIPVGPINLTIVNEGARRGFLWAAMIGLGATVMDLIYCTIAFTGFGSLFAHGSIKMLMQLLSVVFLVYLGTRFLLARNIKAHTRIEERLEARLHPHSAFMTGFIRVLGNPGVLVFWIILAAHFISRGWITTDWGSRAACILGVAVGTGVWFIGLSYAVSLGHRKFSKDTLLKVEHFSGIILLLVALAHGLHLLWEALRLHE